MEIHKEVTCWLSHADYLLTPKIRSSGGSSSSDSGSKKQKQKTNKKTK